MITQHFAWDRRARSTSGAAVNHLMFAVTPRADAVRLPAHVCVLIDYSCSMQSDRKLEHAHRACESIWEVLFPNDWFSVIGYNARAEVLVKPRQPDKLSADDLWHKFSDLELSSATCIDRALARAEQALDSLGFDGASVFVLLTDGHPTDGSGHVIPDASLPEYYATARRLASRGVTMVTVGLGSAQDFNSVFLTRLAEVGQGTFLYAPSTEQLAQRLCEHLQSLQKTVAIRVELHVNSRGFNADLRGLCRISPTHRRLEAERIAYGQWVVAAGALEAGVKTRFLAEVETTPGFSSPEGLQPVLDIAVSWQSPDGTRGTTKPVEARLEFTFNERAWAQGDSEAQRLCNWWEMLRFQEKALAAEDYQQVRERLQDLVASAQRLGANEIEALAANILERATFQDSIDRNAMVRLSQCLQEADIG